MATALDMPSVAAVEPALRRRARELTETLERTGVRGLRVEPDLDGSGTSLGQGLTVVGGSGGARRQAARWLKEILRLKQEACSLSAEILERYEEATLVYRVCDRLADVLGERAISVLVLDEARERLDAESAELWIREADRDRCVATIPPGPTDVPEGNDGAPAIVADTLEQERPTLSAPGQTPHVAVPLPFGEPGLLGAMLFRGRGSGTPFRSGDVKLLQALATLAAAFIRNDHLADAARREAARRREDEIAQAIHRSLLPSRAPRVAGVEVHGVCRAAELIGGDWYGFWSDALDRLGIAVADVSGHGIPAGLCMAQASGVLQLQAARTAGLADALGRVNEDLTENFSRADMFVTASLVRIDPATGAVSYGNAGHVPAIVARTDGRVETLNLRGVALGIVPGIGYGAIERTLAPGDVLLLYTDGISESRDAAGEMYGARRLAEFVSEHRRVPLEELCEGLLASAAAWRDGLACHDDQTVVALRYVGPRGTADGEG